MGKYSFGKDGPTFDNISMVPAFASVTTTPTPASGSGGNNYVRGPTGSTLHLGDGTDNVEIANGSVYTELDGGYYIGTTAGLSQTVVVKGSDGNNCNIVYTGGDRNVNNLPIGN